MDEQELVTARASSSLPVRILRSHALSSPSSKSPGPLSASTRTHVPIQQIFPARGSKSRYCAERNDGRLRNLSLACSRFATASIQTGRPSSGYVRKISYL